LDDVDAAIAFYMKHFGFTIDVDCAPTLLRFRVAISDYSLSGEKTSGRKAMPDGTEPVPGGWNRILLMVSDIELF
jgi:predicted enzyme related to lactoylglutathione lyase